MKKFQRQISSGWVDETLTDRALEAIRSIPLSNDDLEQKIGERLGRYRLLRQFHDTEPQPSVLVRHLSDLASTSHELITGIMTLPPAARALATEILYATGKESFQKLSKQLTRDLVTFSAVMNSVSNRVKPSIGRKGEKPNTLEHSLLSDVAQLLQDFGCGLGRIEEAQKTVEILVAAGVSELPGTPEKARKAIIAWRKAQDKP
ncbi:TPA: hypothetical protein ACQTZZ_004196 [Pseudomonas aeruginosa]